LGRAQRAPIGSATAHPDGLVNTPAQKDAFLPASPRSFAEPSCSLGALVVTMIESKKQRYEPLTCNGRRRCPHCTAHSRLTHSLLDTRNGNTVHVYQCVACGKRVWDDGPKMHPRLQ